MASKSICKVNFIFIDRQIKNDVTGFIANIVLPTLVNLSVCPGRNLSNLQHFVAEICNNAIDYGILQLSATSRSSAKDFKLYKCRREEGLQNVKGQLCIRLKINTVKEKPAVSVYISDSGGGFDSSGLKNRQLRDVPATQFFGRGLLFILENKKARIRFFDPGNKCLLVYNFD